MPEDLHIWVTFAVILVAIVAYVSERVPMELTAAAVVAVLLVFFHVMPLNDAVGNPVLMTEDLLRGFANPALMTVLALLIIGQGLFQTGALDGVAAKVSTLGRGSGTLTVALVLAATCLLSGLLNNTPVVVLMLPVLGAVAAQAQIAPSKVMIPLSFVSILGGMTTLIGSSTNLLVAGQARASGLEPIGFFDFTVMGGMLAAIGFVYAITVLPALLPDRSSASPAAGTATGRQFIARIRIRFGHPLIGAEAVGGMFPALRGMTVLTVQRGSRQFFPPYDDIVLQPGDLVSLAATRAVMSETLDWHVVQSDPVPDERGGEGPDRTVLIAESVVAPGSRLIGRPVAASVLREMTDCAVLGVQRESRMIRMNLSDIRLEAGDVLLVAGSRSQVEGLRALHDVILLEWSAAEVPQTAYARRALAIFAGVVTLAATGVLPIAVAAIAGAMLMVPAGCLNVRQAARAFDRRIYLLVGSSLALATALDSTGGAALIAHSVVEAFSASSPAVLLSAMFLVIAILTNFLSNNATAVLFTPIAIQAALELGADPFPFVVTVILAANCSFATPIGYQTNLLVMGPGQYRFADFARAGAPLVLIIWLAFTFISPWYYGL